MNLQARLYDPSIGSFLSVDPLFETQPGFTPYHYCYNDPINGSDPSGLQFESGCSGNYGSNSGGIIDIGISSKKNTNGDITTPAEWDWHNYAGVGVDGNISISAFDVYLCYWTYWQSESTPTQNGTTSNKSSVLSTTSSLLDHSNTIRKKCEDSSINPSEFYESREEAAHAWALHYNSISIREKSEYASWIIEVTPDDGSPHYFSYTEARRGGYGWSNAGKRPKEPGVKVVGHIHSHANYDGNFLSDTIESGDKQTQINHIHTTMFVVTPNGKLLRLRQVPQRGSKLNKIQIVDTLDYDDIPSDPNHP
jgi:hypothetical protein